METVEAGPGTVRRVTPSGCERRPGRSNGGQRSWSLAAGGLACAQHRIAQCLLRFAGDSAIDCEAYSLTRRTAGCGPACRVVWEWRSREAHPYPNSRGRAVRPYPWVHPHRFGYCLTDWAPTYPASMRSKPFAEPLRQLSANDSDMGSGKMSSSPFSTPSKMARATDSGEAFGTSKPLDISVSTGPARTACTLTPCPAKRARSDCDRESAAAFEIE